ncbi:MAG: putative collagen-binding domain-containing protein [Candidatus Methanoperedens sp.]|nr:putative collagen-binding domain-containing protein [Candidatus Methanoperedens sp.]
MKLIKDFPKTHPGQKDVNLNNPEYLKGMAQMKHLSVFFNSIEYWRMQPNNLLINNCYALVNIGNEYVIYLPAGGSTTIDLSAASDTLSVEWYNPRAGTYHGQTTVQGGAPRKFTAPDSNDRVLHIKGVDSGVNPTIT